MTYFETRLASLKFTVISKPLGVDIHRLLRENATVSLMYSTINIPSTHANCRQIVWIISSLPDDQDLPGAAVLVDIPAEGFILGPPYTNMD